MTKEGSDREFDLAFPAQFQYRYEEDSSNLLYKGVGGYSEFKKAARTVKIDYELAEWIKT